MDDQVLIHILEIACSEENLVFQVVEQDRHLHVFLNREPEQVLDYQVVGKKIYQALSRLSLTDVDGVGLYSRVLGEEEPDWEATFRLPQAKQESRATPASAAQVAHKVVQPVQNETQRQMSEADTYVMEDVAAQRAEAKKSMAEGGGSQVVATRSATAVAAPAAEAANYPLSDLDGVTEAAAAYEAAAPTVSVVAESLAAKPETAAPLDEGFVLSEHCFIRNRMLLTADIVPPSKAVAKQLTGFHEFSMAEKQRMMPQLELFFKGAPTFCAEGLTQAQQSWFQDLEALTGDDARKGPIWLSRYCVDAGTTLEVVARVFDPSLGVAKKEEQVVEEPAADAAGQGGAAHSIGGSRAGGREASPRSPQIRPGNGTANSARQPSSRQSLGQATRAAGKRPASESQWLWPGIVVFGSVFLMCLGMIFAKPAVVASDTCNASAAPEKCQLATQIAGPEFFEDLGANLRPLPVVKAERDLMLTRAAGFCSSVGAEHAGHGDGPSPKKTLLSSNAQEVLPGVVLTDVMYRNAGDAGPVRTACVVTYEAWGDPPEDAELGVADSAVIPASWPTEAYDHSKAQEAELRVEQAFHPLFTFGSTLLFTTVGLFAAALLRMAVTTHNLTALSQAAIAMAIFEGFFDLLLPLNGLLMFPFIVARKSFALGLAGAVIPGFKVDWAGGYMSVAGCVAVMVLVRFVFRWLMITTILAGGWV